MASVSQPAPAPPPSRAASWLYLGLTLLLAVFLLGWEIHDHGRTLDDGVQRVRGEAMLRYLGTLDPSELPGPDLTDFSKGDRLYGPLGATVAVFFGRLLGPLLGDPTQDLHLVFSAGLTLWFLLLFFSTLQLGRHCLGSTLGGVLSGLALLSLPRVLGLATCNPSDMPATATAAFAVWQLAGWLTRPTWPRIALVCLGFAATAAVRAQNGALLLVAAIFFLLPRIREGLPRLQLFVAPALCYALWILLWPDFWEAPITGPLEVLRGFLGTSGRHLQGTLWFGELAQGPPLYPAVWIAITTPLWILLPAFAGAVVGRRHPLFLGMLALFGLAAGKHITGVANFGGIRHFLEAFVPLAIWTASGVLWLTSWLLGRAGRGIALVGLVAAFVFAASLHPFESLYFNVLVGGTRGAAGRFDLEPNGSSFILLLRRLRPHLDARSVLLMLGPDDIVYQIPLPEGVLTHPVLPDSAPLLETAPVQEMLRDRRVFLLVVQGRVWGILDDLIADGLVVPVVQVGPYGLPANLAVEVRDASVYPRISRLFR